MADVFLEWQGDFLPDGSGDLTVIDGDAEVRQRLERRLFTAVKGYVWHPDYGAGLPQKIGDPFSLSTIKSIVMSQIALEASVAPNPPPVVVITQGPNDLSTFTIAIQYYDAAQGTSVSFSIAT